MKLWEMLVETPVCEAELEDRERRPGREGQNQCSYCGVAPANPDDWYDIHDVMVVRHWTTDSKDVPGGGHWTWYCPRHFAQRRGRWWKTSYLAPARLLPEVTYPCVHVVAFGESCGQKAVEPFDDAWYCEQHANVQRVNRRIQELLEGDDEPDPLVADGALDPGRRSS